MNQNVFNKIVGKPSTWPGKDSDKDGVINFIDCKPYNPKKQGWIHDLKNKIGEKIEEHQKFRAEERESEFLAKSKAIEAGREERIKQAQITERFKIKQQAAQERAKIKTRYSGKSSGGFGSFVSGVNNVSNAMLGTSTTRTSVPRATKRKVVTYVKKGKHYVKKTSYRPVRTGGSGNTTNNQRQFPNIMGVGGNGNKPRAFQKGWI